ncbi:MAG: serine/threonine-protein kinase [Synechococcales cyanobacterium]
MVRNRYRAYRKIGQGGFGSTFLVQDMDLPSKPWRVIKQLRLNEANPQIAELSLELFNREAEVLEKLGQHSQIPSLYAHFEEHKNYYLVQEFVTGKTLSREVHDNGPMNELQARQVMQEVLLILSYVHSQSTVHRDIKPANLIRRKDDQRLVLIDFGAVKQLGGDSNSAVENTAIRSMGFSPPEQISGHQVNASSDLYALAATCLNLLTLESPTNFYDHSTGQWNWSSKITLSSEFDDILRTMLNPAMDQRFASATEALRALQGLKTDNSHLSRVSVASGAATPKMLSTDWSARKDNTGIFTPTTGFTPVQPPSVITQPTLGSSITGFSPRTGAMAIQPATPPRVPSMANADLRDRSFSNQNLARRDFRKADLRGADFSGANLQSADLRGVIFNTPKPKIVELLRRIGGGALTIGGVAMGLAGLLGSLIVPAVGVWHFTSNIWLALGSSVVAGSLTWSFLWSAAGKKIRAQGSDSKRHTRFYRTDLRGAQMEDKLRQFAKQQGALLD